MDDLDKVLFDRGKEILGKAAGGVIRELKEKRGLGIALELLEAANRKENPMEYIQGILRAPPTKIQPTTTARDAVAAEEIRDRASAWGNGRYFNFMDLLGIRQKIQSGISIDEDEWKAVTSYQRRGNWPQLKIPARPGPPPTPDEKDKKVQELRERGMLTSIGRKA